MGSIVISQSVLWSGKVDSRARGGVTPMWREAVLAVLVLHLSRKGPCWGKGRGGGGSPEFPFKHVTTGFLWLTHSESQNHLIPLHAG